ncbi:MAG: hypothetical protein V4702_01215, partial [Patescibacteria group bacterium]
SGGSGCGASGSTAWTCTTVDDDTDSTGNRASLAFDPSGTPWVSYYDTSAFSLMVAKYVGSGGSGCGASGSTAWTCTTVDNDTDDTGDYTSLAFDPSGTPWVSYYDSSATSLMVAKYVGSGGSGCGASGSTAWTCTTVDNDTDSTGFYTSLAFDPSGTPWVSYFDSSAFSLMVAKYVGSGGSGCGASGSTAWTCTTVDNDTDTTGISTSLAFDPSGTPWVSYSDASASSLMVARLDRGGEIVLSPGAIGANGDALSESHADMTTATDTTNRDDTADCLNASNTWNNGKWFESEEANGLNLKGGAATAQCTEVSFTIDTSQAVAGRTYRFIIATDDAMRQDKGKWRGPIAVSSGAYPTLTIAADTTQKFSKDNGAKFPDCTDTAWGCSVVQDLAANADYSSMAIDPASNPWVSFRGTDGTNGTLVVAQYVGTGGSCTSSAWTCTTVDDPTNAV